LPFDLISIIKQIFKILVNTKIRSIHFVNIVMLCKCT